MHHPKVFGGSATSSTKSTVSRVSMKVSTPLAPSGSASAFERVGLSNAATAIQEADDDPRNRKVLSSTLLSAATATSSAASAKEMADFVNAGKLDIVSTSASSTNMASQLADRVKDNSQEVVMRRLLGDGVKPDSKERPFAVLNPHALRVDAYESTKFRLSTDVIELTHGTQTVPYTGYVYSSSLTPAVRESAFLHYIRDELKRNIQHFIPHTNSPSVDGLKVALLGLADTGILRRKIDFQSLIGSVEREVRWVIDRISEILGQYSEGFNLITQTMHLATLSEIVADLDKDAEAAFRVYIMEAPSRSILVPHVAPIDAAVKAVESAKYGDTLWGEYTNVIRRLMYNADVIGPEKVTPDLILEHYSYYNERYQTTASVDAFDKYTAARNSEERKAMRQTAEASCGVSPACRALLNAHTAKGYAPLVRDEILKCMRLV